jgi:hypothetical protein
MYISHIRNGRRRQAIRGGQGLSQGTDENGKWEASVWKGGVQVLRNHFRRGLGELWTRWYHVKYNCFNCFSEELFWPLLGCHAFKFDTYLVLMHYIPFYIGSGRCWRWLAGRGWGLLIVTSPDSYESSVLILPGLWYDSNNVHLAGPLCDNCQGNCLINLNVQITQKQVIALNEAIGFMGGSAESAFKGF